MSEELTGGKLAAQKIKKTYGENFFKEIGAKGGKKSVGGGFTGDPKRASEAGKKGIKIRWEKYRKEQEEKNNG